MLARRNTVNFHIYTVYHIHIYGMFRSMNLSHRKQIGMDKLNGVLTENADFLSRFLDLTISLVLM